MIDVILYLLPWPAVFYFGMRWERYRKKSKRSALKRRIEQAKELAQNSAGA